MRVLLISPLDPETPGNLKNLMGGENTYTNILLNHPPQGVIFIHFFEARNRKMVSYHPLYYVLLLFQKIRLLPPGPRAYVFTSNTDFDLVYAHAHPIKIVGKKIPLVISDSSSNSVFLNLYLYIPHWLSAVWKWTKYTLFSLCGVIDGEVNTYKAGNMFVFSEWARNIKIKEFGIKNAKVIYPGLPGPGNKEKRNEEVKGKKKIKIMFAGTWFERKGGRILLVAFENLLQKYPHIRLTMIGQIPADILIRKYPGIFHKNFVPRQTILSYYKTHQILVHIPPVAEGYGMVVPEAMSYGLCPVVSDVCALPELVQHNKTGLVVSSGSVEAVESALENVIMHPKLISLFGNAARKRFEKEFQIKNFQKKLFDAFSLSIASAK